MRLWNFTLLLSMAAAESGLAQSPFNYHWPPRFDLVEVAPRVWSVIEGPNFTDIVHGNTTFIVSDSEVVAVDANATPAAAREAVRLLKTRTKAPIRRVVYTHWHQDHLWGTQSYFEAYHNPIELIAQDSTRIAIMKNARDRHEVVLKALPGALRANDSLMGLNRDFNGKSLDPVGGPQFFRDRHDAMVYREKELQKIVYRIPTTTFDRRMTLFSGQREIQLHWFGRANTKGDAIIYLPAERVVVSGDVLVSPIPYPFGSYLSEWRQVLDSIAALDPVKIVPGHGPVMTDLTYLRQVASLLDTTLAQTRRALSDGLTQQQAAQRIDLSAMKAIFAHGDPYLERDFDQITPVLSNRAYLELKDKT